MNKNLNRRQLFSRGAALLGFAGLREVCMVNASASENVGAGGVGVSELGVDLVVDPLGRLDLPQGFRYSILSRSGEVMKGDGLPRPGKPDGMGCFSREDGLVELIINHEINQKGDPLRHSFPFGEKGENWPQGIEKKMAWAWTEDGPQPGGTSTLIWDPQTGEVVDEFLSLTGTDRNCAGGVTPWGSWITCEEPDPEPEAEEEGQHGWCFEVPQGQQGLVEAVALRRLGRFRHEAIAVDPRTGVIYLTEDIGAGLFYRWVPDEFEQGQRPDLQKGRLQALCIGDTSINTSNWEEEEFPVEQGSPVSWVDIDDVEAKQKKLRKQGAEKGAALFSRAEGIVFDELSNTVFFVCTDGGPQRCGQLFAYTPALEVEDGGVLELFLQSKQDDLLQNGDNMCVLPSGDLLVCEDHREKNDLVVVTTSAQLRLFARNPKSGDEFAGACFHEESATLFVNQQGAGLTFAISGPWQEWLAEQE